MSNGSSVYGGLPLYSSYQGTTQGSLVCQNPSMNMPIQGTTGGILTAQMIQNAANSWTTMSTNGNIQQRQGYTPWSSEEWTLQEQYKNLLLKKNLFKLAMLK